MAKIEKRGRNKAYFITDLPLYESAGVERTDGLGFVQYAEVLAESAINTEGPFTIGVNGSWGQGKTSLLRIIEKKLMTYDNIHHERTRMGRLIPLRSNSDANIIIPVRFNAWQFENESSPLLPLILTINAALMRAKKNGVDNRRAIKKLSKVLTSVAAGVIASSEISIEASKVFRGSFRLGEFMSSYKEHSHPSNKIVSLLTHRSAYYQAFQLLNELCEHLDSKIKIVIFIDDLDRCSPAKALQILESIKLVLWQPGFIFFLALDSQQLERYINELEGDSEKIRGRKYFEKLLQVNFRIPQHDDGYVRFIDQLFKQLEWGNEGKSIKPLLGAPLDFNPRRTIRLLNSIQLIRQLLPKQAQFDIQVITVEVLLSIRYENIYYLLCQGLAADNEALRKIISEWLSEETNFADGSPEFKADEMYLADLWNMLAADERYVTILSSGPGRAWLEASEEDRRVIARLIADQKVVVDFAIDDAGTAIESNLDDQILSTSDVSEESNKKEIDTLWGVAEHNIRKNRFVLAEKALLKILKIDEKNAAAYNRLGILYAKQKEYRDAIDCFEIAKSIEATPSSLHNLGLVYYETENYEKASTALKAALKLEENLAARHVAYAKVNEKLGREKLMFKALERAVELEPNKETYTLLMQAYEERDMQAEAELVARRLKRHDNSE